MRALGRNLIIEPIDEKVGLIIIPSKKPMYKRGKVLSIGEVKDSEVEVGDIVVYDCTGCTVEDGNDIIRYDMVLFIYEAYD